MRLFLAVCYIYVAVAVLSLPGTLWSLDPEEQHDSGKTTRMWCVALFSITLLVMGIQLALQGDKSKSTMIAVGAPAIFLIGQYAGLKTVGGTGAIAQESTAMKLPYSMLVTGGSGLGLGALAGAYALAASKQKRVSLSALMPEIHSMTL